MKVDSILYDVILILYLILYLIFYLILYLWIRQTIGQRKFIGLRGETYSYLIDSGSEDKEKKKAQKSES